MDGAGADAGFSRCATLGAHIEAAGGILADQHDRQTGGDAGGGDFACHLGAQGGSQGFAVDQPSRHSDSSLAAKTAMSPATCRVLSRLVWPSVTATAEAGTSSASASTAQAARLARPSSAASLTPMRRQGPRAETLHP